MSEPHPSEQTAHIIIHDRGLGAPTPATVEQRARELALIAGRLPNDFTVEDLRQANLELTHSSRDETPEPSLPFEPGSGEVLGGAESQIANLPPDDENTTSEELIREGMDEALHDEMLEARKLDPS